MRRLALLAVLAVPACAAPADALTLAHGIDAHALALRGDSVLVASASPGAPHIELLRGAQRPVVLSAGTVKGCTNEVELAASEQLLAIDLRCPPRIEDYVLAAPAGPPTQAPVDVVLGPRPGGVAVSGDRLAFVEHEASGAVIHVRDDTHDVLVPVEAGLNASTVRVRLAGDHLAYVAGIPGATVSLRVVDLTTGAVTTSYDSDIVDFDVAADGALALLRRDRNVPCGARLLVAQPGQAAPVGVVDCARPLGVRLANGQAAYDGRDGVDLFDFATGAVTRRQRLSSSVPAGGRTTFAFDGARIAYTVPSCAEGVDVVLDPLSGAAPSPIDRLACPLELPAQSPRVRDGRATFAVSCPEAAATCT